MKKKFLSLMTVLCVLVESGILFGISSVSADSYGDLTYKVSNGKVTITDCSESVTSVTIPETIDGYPVESIGYAAFRFCDGLTNITIPNGVTSIRDDAFYYCKSLIDITIPDSVTNVGEQAFEGCTNLKSVTIGDSVTSIGDNAFSSCNSLTSITIPDCVTSVGGFAFANCSGLLSVIIGDSVTSIKDWTFSGCTNLKSITIGDSVTGIGTRAFAYCRSLTDIVVDENNIYYSSEDGNLFNKDKTTLIQYAIGKTNTNYTIPESVTSIGSHAFWRCMKLKSITIGNSVTSIRSYAFSGCYLIDNVYYNGSEEQWKKISISSNNECITSAAIHYNYNESFDIDISSKKIKVKSDKELKNVQLIVALYSNEILTDLKSITVDISKGENSFESLITDFWGADKVKIFVWDDFSTPAALFATCEVGI